MLLAMDYGDCLSFTITGTWHTTRKNCIIVPANKINKFNQLLFSLNIFFKEREGERERGFKQEGRGKQKS
jgi:hypothetical protein